MADVVKNLHLKQSIEQGVDGNLQRVYKITLQFEDAKLLKAKLGISFSHLAKVFSDGFVPALMNETLKELRRAAEVDLAGSVIKNTGDLKTVLKKTTKATKVTRGTENEEEDDVQDQTTQNKDQQSDSDNSNKDDEQSEGDQAMDIDGVQK